jgi:hypothetical protein
VQHTTYAGGAGLRSFAPQSREPTTRNKPVLPPLPHPKEPAEALVQL